MLHKRPWGHRNQTPDMLCQVCKREFASCCWQRWGEIWAGNQTTDLPCLVQVKDLLFADNNQDKFGTEKGPICHLCTFLWIRAISPASKGNKCVFSPPCTVQCDVQCILYFKTNMTKQWPFTIPWPLTIALVKNTNHFGHWNQIYRNQTKKRVIIKLLQFFHDMIIISGINGNMLQEN